MFSNKRGESLVEVLVAITVYMLIFVGAANMITAAVTLNLSSASRTESVSKSQKYMNEYLAGISDVGICTVKKLPADPIEVKESRVNGVDDVAGCEVDGALTMGGDHCYWVELQSLTADERKQGGVDEVLPAKDFIKVVVKAKWYTRIIGEQSFQVSRIIRNAE